MAANNNNTPNKTQATVYTLEFDNIFRDALDKWLAGDSSIFSSPKIIEHLNIKIRTIERGDIVDVPHSVDGAPAIRWIWNGEHYIAFTTDIPEDSDCDAIPEEFKVVTEFPIHYWSKTNLRGTCYGCDDVHFDYTPFIDEICDNITIRITKALGSSISTFFHFGETVYIIEFDRGIANLIDKNNFSVAQLEKDIRKVLTGSSQWIITFAAKPVPEFCDAELKKMVGSNTLFAHFHK